MNLLLQLLGIWLWMQSWRVNGEVVIMCFWILWFQSGFPSQTKVGPLQNGPGQPLPIMTLLCGHPWLVCTEGNASGWN